MSARVKACRTVNEEPAIDLQRLVARAHRRLWPDGSEVRDARWFQPPSNYKNRIDVTVPSPDRRAPQGAAVAPSIVMADGLPFARYWQSRDQERYALHPMKTGRYIHQIAPERDAVSRAKTVVEQSGAHLPNGGLAFYYPNTYTLSRMTGNEHLYSAISQADILAGLMRLHEHHPDGWARARMREVFEAHLFPYDEGGVNMSGLAQLEMPLPHSCPEIILNGQLHALLRIADYAAVHGSELAGEHLQSCLQFFASRPETWYDSRHRISRYSDYTPQRLSAVPLMGGGPLALRVAYRSRIGGVRDYTFPLNHASRRGRSGYDSRLISHDPQTGRVAVVVGTSGTFETTLVADVPFTVSIHLGEYSPDRSIPTRSSATRLIKSRPLPRCGGHVAHLDDARADLFEGFATNFAKPGGKNYYHMQHVVALLLLSRHPAIVDATLRQTLREIAEDWYRGIEEFEHAEISRFESPQRVLRAIMGGSALPFYEQAEQLFEDCDVQLLAVHRRG